MFGLQRFLIDLLTSSFFSSPLSSLLWIEFLTLGLGILLLTEIEIIVKVVTINAKLLKSTLFVNLLIIRLSSDFRPHINLVSGLRMLFIILMGGLKSSMSFFSFLSNSLKVDIVRLLRMEHGHRILLSFGDFSRWNLVRDLLVRALELKMEILELRLGQNVSAVVLLSSAEGLLHLKVFWMVDEILISESFGNVFAIISELSTVNLVPRMLFIIVFYVEFLLLELTLHGNLPKISKLMPISCIGGAIEKEVGAILSSFSS